MTPENLFHEMLGLGKDWAVLSCVFESSSGLVTIEVGETAHLWESYRCPNDQGQAFCYDHAEVRVWRHLNVFEHKCEIHCRLPRARCRTCHKVHRVVPPWEGRCIHFTKSFEAMSLLLLREMPVAKVARFLDETDTRFWRMVLEHVEAAYKKKDMSEVTCVGLDEMNIRKGHQYLTVFADLKAKAVLFATEGRDGSTWERFIAEWEKHEGHRHQLTHVSMDMSRAYRAAVPEWCRNAQIIFDKYHVVSHVCAAVDEVRKNEMRFGTWETQTSLKKSLWLWRKNPENLSVPEKDRLALIQEKHLWTAKAYQMRLVFQDIYRSATAEDARRRFQVWARWVRLVAARAPRNYFAAMRGSAKMVLNHLEGILAHWEHKLTNAFMEGLNSVFSATKRRARGYRSSKYLIAILYLVSAKLKIPFH